MISKVYKEEYLRHNNVYRDDNILRIQVPHILSGTTYRIGICDDELYHLRKTNRDLYDKIAIDLLTLSDKIGQIALDAAKKIEEETLLYISNLEKELGK